MTLREVRLEPEAPTDGYPFGLPAVRGLIERRMAPPGRGGSDAAVGSDRC